MPTFEITAPGGAKYQIDAPEGATEQEALAKLQEHLKAAPSVGANDLVRAGARGVPILGGLLNKADAAVNATLAPVVEPFLSKSPDNLTAGTQNWAERYQKGLGIQNKMDTEFEKAHPILNTAAELTGGIASTLPIATTALGARALGLTGNTLLGQMGRGAVANAGLGAADATTRGGDPLTSGLIGGVIGGAVPGVARIGSAIAAPLVTTARGIINPAGEAARRVGTALERDVRGGSAGMTDAEYQAAQAAGQPVTTMELGGELTRGLARSAANTSPEGRALLDRTINDRFETQGHRLTDWLRSTFHYPNAVSQQTALEQAQRGANNANYTRAMQEGSRGIWSPELEALSGSDAVAGAMRKAASVARDENIVSGYGAMNPHITFTPDGRIQFTRGPSGVPTYPDLQFWDLTRRQLSNGAAMARRAGDMEEARRLGNFASRLNAELDVHVPSYATARGTHAMFEGASNALEAGQNFVTSKLGNREARLALAQMSPIERRLFQDGYVDRFVQLMRENPDRRSALDAIRSPASRERLDIALGPQRSAELQAMMHVEGIMDRARGAVQGNSTTARQLAELGLAGGAGTALGGGNPFDPQSMISAALVYGAARGRNVINERVSHQVARMLTSADPTQVRNAVRMLAQPRMLGALRLTDSHLASLAARAATPAMTMH